ncbi:MAG: ribonuclease HII [Chloroflexi bacterium]|nr:MAG: ribonuclease HII [Chloroflexota bacterium]
MVRPTLDHEAHLWQTGYRYVAGVDEAGRGALAGPVVAAVVIVPAHSHCQGVWTEVCDSKLLTATQRSELVPRIQAAAVAWGIGAADAAVIDAMGIAAATKAAMTTAIRRLAPQPDFLLIDWVRLPQVSIAQESRVKADRDLVSVAAASILAKVWRDHLMAALHDCYPRYGFDQHKGYGTAAHRAALAEHGPCPEHRHTFAPIARPATLFDDQ